MRALMLFSLLAVAVAQYDYRPGVGLDSTGSVLGLSTGFVSRGAAQLSEPIQTQPLLTTEFNKEFYTYTAPEHDFEDARGHEQMLSNLKRNVRVLFIKGPENAGLERAALQLAQSAVEDRTAIYVLSKQADVSELAVKLNQLKSTINNKPEVHFVKYRTDADAENAQRTIQSQYDSLPGPTSNHNAGISPVLDFATKAIGGSGSGSSLAPASGFISTPSSTYLPPSRRI